MKTVQRGIPAILAESGQQGILNMDDALVHTTGIKNVMKHLGMIDGEVVDTVKRMDLKYNGAIRNEVKGMWYPFVSLNQKVDKDETVGEIRDYFGVCLKEIKSPIDGLVTVVRTRPSVDKGNVLIEFHHMTENSF